MTQEQKAKAYDKALERAKEFVCKDNVEVAEYIFPELKESEDERIRKSLIEMIHDTTGDELWVDYNVHKEEALAWLEKQKTFDYECANIKQKDFAPNDEEMKELLRTEYEKGKYDTIAEMQGEQKSTTIDVDKMVSDYASHNEKRNEIFGKPVP